MRSLTGTLKFRADERNYLPGQICRITIDFNNAVRLAWKRIFGRRFGTNPLQNEQVVKAMSCAVVAVFVLVQRENAMEDEAFLAQKVRNLNSR